MNKSILTSLLLLAVGFSALGVSQPGAEEGEGAPPVVADEGAQENGEQIEEQEGVVAEPEPAEQPDAMPHERTMTTVGRPASSSIKPKKNKKIKIAVGVTAGVLAAVALSIGAFFGIRHVVKKKKDKKEADAPKKEEGKDAATEPNPDAQGKTATPPTPEANNPTPTTNDGANKDAPAQPQPTNTNNNAQKPNPEPEKKAPADADKKPAPKNGNEPAK